VAPGLVLLGLAALVLPWATRKNIYCQHVCPHGAAQLLVNQLSPWKKKLSIGKKLDRILKCIPAILLVLVVAILMRVLSIDLASIEPFDAWLIGIGGMASVAIAVVGLVLSAFTAQPYCKYGCPTGALLEFVRSKRASERFSAMDGLAGMMVMAAAVAFFL
ncbi:4Fe-4S binding protein, partial [Arenicella sp.]|nr:4Fe-4S binding protein [Arenicella sp.]